MLTASDSLPETGESRFGPPVSPSLFEHLQTCHRKAAYRRSRAHPARSSPAARLGDAFHHTLERLAAPPPEASGLQGREWRGWVVAYFQNEVAKRRQIAAAHPREAALPWPEPQEESLAIQLATLAGSGPPPPRNDLSGEARVRFVERELVSNDGLLRGRPDLVEREANGLTIIDHKTGDLSGAEKQERYRRQCLLYAVLVHETLHEWPTAYRVVQAVTGEELSGAISPDEATALAAEVRALTARYEGKLWRDLPAAPSSATCQSCDYRPWCADFWKIRPESLTESVCMEAILEKLNAPPQGTIAYLTCRLLPECTETVNITAPQPLAQGLLNLPTGTRLRLLDIYPVAASPTSFRATHWSEMFAV